jgi:CRP/FNR family cyclic AMP-dependent transcriptional regulator
MRTRARNDARLTGLGLTAAETSALAGVTTVVEVAVGTVLYRQGTSGHQLAWIVDGEADVLRFGDIIARVGAGDVLGEGTMLGAHDTCSADVVAATDMTVAVLSQRDWQVAAYRAPSLVSRLFEVALDREPALAA